MDEWDIRFWKNKAPPLRTIKGGPQDRKRKDKLVQNAWKWWNDRFCWKIWPTSGQIIFRTKCDRDKPLFLQKREINKIELGIKGTQWDLKMSKKGSIPGTFHTNLKYGSALPPDARSCSVQRVESSLSHVIRVLCSSLSPNICHFWH